MQNMLYYTSKTIQTKFTFELKPLIFNYIDTVQNVFHKTQQNHNFGNLSLSSYVLPLAAFFYAWHSISMCQSLSTIIMTISICVQIRNSKKVITNT